MIKNNTPIILIWSIITVCLLVGFGKFAHNLVEQELQIQVKESLNSILISNVTALNSWIQEKKRYTKTLASRPKFLQKIRSILTHAQNATGNKATVQNDKETLWLKNNLIFEANFYGFTGFLLFDTQGNVLVTNSDTSLDKFRFPKFILQKSLGGKTSISKPFKSHVSIKDQNGNYRVNWPTMLASTPIYQKNGDILGVLAFRIRPETDFSQIINIAKPGITGQSYAVDRMGMLLSETDGWQTKFNPEGHITTQILKTNLQQKNAGLPDQGGNGKLGNATSLTRMADSLVKGKSGVDVSGYLDYRGTPVVGAWTWVTELDLGLATEMEFSEAFKAIQTLKSVLGAIFGLLVMISGIGMLFYMRKRNHQILMQAAKETAEKENHIKTQFLTRMSHDLRSPMSVILGFSELLESDPENPLDENQEIAVEQISKAGENLMDLVNEIFQILEVEPAYDTLQEETDDKEKVFHREQRYVS
jgi:hypothetical protein